MFKKRPNICYKDLVLILQHFKHRPLQSSPSTGDTPFLTFLPLLEWFLERTFCDGAQFSYRILLNLLYGLETTSFKVVLSLGNRKKSK